MPVPDAPGARVPSAADAPDRLAAARRTVRRRRRQVAVHLIVYALVNAVLVAAWLSGGLVSGDWFPWPLLSLAGWGLVLQAHAWWAHGPLNRLVREDVLVDGTRSPGRP